MTLPRQHHSPRGPGLLSAEPRPGTFKSSLRKIPSSFFRGGNGSADADSTMRKDKTQRRKGLAGILGWGRRETEIPPVPAPPVDGNLPKPLGKAGATIWNTNDLRTAPPVAVSTTTAATMTTSKLPPPPTENVNHPSRSGWARSLRSSSSSADRPVPEHKTRPSCPPDPFERVEGGARIVGCHFPATARRPNAKATETERPSPKIKTVSIDDFDDDDDVNDLDNSWVESLDNFQVAPLALEFDSDQSIEVPCCSVKPKPAAQVPRDKQRFSSYGRTLENKLEPIREAPEPTLSEPAINRQRTKSRVWGMLTGKSRKYHPEASSISKSSLSRPTTPFDGLATKPPIPIVHVTHPSNNSTPSSPPKLQTTPLLDPDSPLMTRRQASHSTQKSLPKRKSLSGLFGISMKKSSDKLRFGRPSPRSSPKRKAAPATPKASPKKAPSPAKDPKADPSTPIRVGDVYTFEDDTSPDTVAFYSRFGNMGFNPEGSSTQADVTISDTSSATTQLARFLASVHTTASPMPLRKMRPPLIAPKGSHAVKSPSSVESSPGAPRNGSVGPASPSVGRRTPVAELMMGMRTMFGSASSPTPSAGTVRSRSDSDVKPRPAEESHVVAPAIDISPPVAEISKPQDPETSDSNSYVSPFTALPPTAFRPVGGLPPAPTAQRKVDRLGQRRQQAAPAPAPAPVPVPQVVVESEESAPTNQGLPSFDFTREILSLNCGDGRTSFITALHKALSQEGLKSPLKQYSPSSRKTTPHAGKPTTAAAHRSPGFQGDAAFQKFVELTKKPDEEQPSALALGPPQHALPSLPAPEFQPQANHRRDTSTMSFASISSLGMPLGGSSLSHDYTNYFENNYTGIDDILPPPLPPLAPMPTYNNGASLTRHRHQRSASGSSIGSLAGAEISYVSGSIRMSSRPARPALVTRHQPQSSTDSTTGRSDWRAHRRISSSASSVVSVSRISRPTIGERMFERDERVKLNSFHEGENMRWSISSFASFASCDASGEAESAEASNRESLFGASSEPAGKNFFIKGPPISGISMSDDEDPDDTFSGMSKALKEVQDEIAAPTGNLQLRDVAPTRPVRHRPEPLRLSDYSLDTPGLDTCYTSADDSSVFSWDARSFHASNPPLSGSLSSSFSTFFPPMHTHHHHQRQHSSIASAGIKVDATIPEENSQSTLRSLQAASPVVPERDNFNYWDDSEQVGHSVTASWLKWQREAEDICHQNKHAWMNSTATDEELIGFRQPSTSLEIETFLAESQARYKPLEQLPHVVHRRKVSFSRQTSRISASPYCAPIPRLESRFRNSKSSTDSESSRPVSALLLEFAREQAPLPAPKIPGSAKKHSSKLPGSAKKHAYLNSESDGEFRRSVTSSVRRRNLGWGRTRPLSEEGPPASPFRVIVNDEDVFQPRNAARPRREKQPSFICFSPQHGDTDDTDGPSRCPSPSPSPKTVPLTLLARPAPPRRRTLSVKVNANGSPVNLNSAQEFMPLADRKSGDRRSYEPGYSPMRMRPLHPTSAGTVRPAASAKGKARSTAAVTASTGKPMPARPALKPTTRQSTHKSFQASSSPRFQNLTATSGTAQAQIYTRPAPNVSGSRRAPQNENSRTQSQSQPKPVPVAVPARPVYV